MILIFSILFIVTMLSGCLVYVIPKWKGDNFNIALIFSGSYLFGITIIHILPELFNHDNPHELTGALVLAGFFIQMFLEYFTSGIEHGHIHKHDHAEQHSMATSVSMLTALCLHAFMEGTLLAHPTTIHAHHQSNALLIGVLLHKIPAAFALMSLLTCHFKSKATTLIFLFIFAIASPIGLAVSDYVTHNELLSGAGFVVIFALVSGSFLKISTTIFFESSPEHQFSLKKIVVSAIAACVAILAEQLF